MTTLKAGYTIKVISWENDGDNYNSKSAGGLTREQTQFYVDICNLMSGEFGNMYDPSESEIESLNLEVKRICELHLDTVHELFEDTRGMTEIDLEMCGDIFLDVRYDFFGSSDYYTRVLSELTVTYIPHDIELKDVTHEFM